MRIESQLVKIESPLPPDNEYIEEKLLGMGIKPLRWAIVKVDSNLLTLSVACECS